MKELEALAKEDGKEEELAAAALEAMRANPDHPIPLFYFGLALAKTENHGAALTMFRAADRLSPDHPDLLNNMGMALTMLGKPKDGVDVFIRALQKKPLDAMITGNYATALIELGQYARAAQLAERAVELEPLAKNLRVTRGYAKLYLGAWKDAWQDHSCAVGNKQRKYYDYGLTDWFDYSRPDRPAVNMTTDCPRVVVQAEQGLGDELMYAGLLRRFVARYNCAEVVLDVDARLKSLFARSFPEFTVYGTRRGERSWLANHPGLQYQIPMGEIPRALDLTTDTATIRPFLETAPLLNAMYNSLQAAASNGHKVRVGLTWSGGSKNNHPEARELGTEALVRLMAAIRMHVDAAFFSLQYRQTTHAEIDTAKLDIQHHHFAVGLNANYDHTAAYVRNLDLVVGVDTAALHTAGALGIPTIMLLNDHCTWMQNTLNDDRSVWYQTTRVLRQRPGETWNAAIARFSTSGELEAAIKGKEEVTC